ncbi:EpsG family protein [Chryseobacterium paridis]|uniref:EpsG family protein n=1 Tax=Chryseobacterium paridis TaxID=2800328 RepID=A0ABS1FZ36_9FLAO|nr:EpsG family protein [Chryseobacterium paridis]MBK1897706.1 EpsG family protein [Chryseobacterium paridis]
MDVAIYLIPFLILSLVSSVVYLSRFELKNYWLILFVALFPAILVAILSGDSGTDKAYYYVWIENTYNGNFDEVIYEPGFKYLTYFISLIKPSEYFIIPVVAFITTLFLIFSFSENKWQLLVFTFILFPFFYFDMTMNGLRYGLSFAMCAFAAKKQAEKNTLLFFLFGILAVSMQYSSVIIVIIVYFSQVQLKKIHLLLLLVLGYVIFQLLDFSYFDNKVDVYKDLSRPSGISGLSPLVLFLIIFGINWYLNKKVKTIFFIILILEVLSFLISLKSYSGLRFQNLIIFTLIIFISFFQEIQPFRKRNIMLFFLIGFLSFGLKIRNFMNEDEGAVTPFLPYEFYWERK